MTELEEEASKTRTNFEGGLGRENVDQASELICNGRAVLKILVYPWGVEFGLVQGEPAGRGDGNDTEDAV